MRDFFYLPHEYKKSSKHKFVFQSILWSGTYDITHRYAADGARYVTMEDSLIGYLSNGLQWCGSLSPAGDGINYTSCPNWQDLPKQASQAYWGGASSTVLILFWVRPFQILTRAAK